jgi:hypothetical protein
MHPQRRSQPEDGSEGRVANPALDAADVGAVQVDLEGELLLGQPQFLSLTPNRPAEGREVGRGACGSAHTGRRRLLAAIHDPSAIQAVLAALELSGEVPALAPARAPPDADWVAG